MQRFFNGKKGYLRKTLCLGAVAFLVSAVPMKIYAEPGQDTTTYGETEIDPFTGEPVNSGTTVNYEVSISQDVSYEPASAAFTYQFGTTEDYVLRSTVADGMYVNADAVIEAGKGLSVKLYRNGHEDSQQLNNITLPGSYVLMISPSTGGDTHTMSFRIIDEYTNAQGFNAPDGFVITSVKKDQKRETGITDYISLSDEGTYSVSYMCEASKLVYTFHATVDHTAPTLALEAVDEEGYAYGEVDLSDLEEGAVMYIDQDGKRISPVKVLRVPGRYEISVQDPAGNTSHYSFTIRMYFTHGLWVVLFILLAALTGLGIYVYMARKNLQVR